MQLQGGRAELVQTLDFPVDSTGKAAVSVKTHQIQDRLSLVVQDVPSGTRVGSSAEERPTRDWHEIRAPLHTSGHDSVRLRPVAEGTGQV